MKTNITDEQFRESWNTIPRDSYQDKVRFVADACGVAEQTVYVWRCATPTARKIPAGKLAILKREIARAKP
jgi:hypothetical protein